MNDAEFRQAMDNLLSHVAANLERQCCPLHIEPGCCDPEDCGPCCPNCPTCPKHQGGGVQ